MPAFHKVYIKGKKKTSEAYTIKAKIDEWDYINLGISNFL